MDAQRFRDNLIDTLQMIVVAGQEFGFLPPHITVDGNTIVKGVLRNKERLFRSVLRTMQGIFPGLKIPDTLTLETAGKVQQLVDTIVQHNPTNGFP